ncbi:MAG: hypothetical protein ACRDV9_01570 [Acidimicrobiia bacterium]
MANESDLFANQTEDERNIDLGIPGGRSKATNGAIGGAFVGGLFGIIIALGFGMPGGFDPAMPWGEIIAWAIGGTTAGALVGGTSAKVREQLES